MLKLFRRKKTQTVIRVEDLQIGDLMQVDLENRAIVRNVYETKNDYFEIKLQLEDVDEDHPQRHQAVALHRDLKLFVWK